MEKLNTDAESLFTAIQQDISSIDQKEKVIEHCFQKIIETLKAERGFLVLYDKESNAMKPVAAHNLNTEILLCCEEISQTILNEAIKSVKPIILSDALSDPRFEDKTSVVLSGLRSVLCVPISSEQGLLGVLYADNRLRAAAYKEEHLHFLNDCTKKIAEILQKYYPDIQPMPKSSE
jgi:GAF domain-containing protein